jgi:G3E family GTPase
VRGDLIRILDGLMKRKGKFDAIIVETTGLADPAPVAQTFFMDQDVSDAARLDAVVTVADAKWLSDRLKDAPEAKNQIAFADVIILNKIDLVSEKELEEVEARIRAINPYAKVHRTQNCAIPISEVLDRKAFDLDRIIELEPDFLEEGHHHHHDEEMQSVSVAIDGEVDPEKFMPWISNLTQVEGPNILRCKGIVAFPDEPKRFVFQGVHMILDGDVQGEWKPGEKHTSKVVFIGRDLNEKAIREGFLACAA